MSNSFQARMTVHSPTAPPAGVAASDTAPNHPKPPIMDVHNAAASSTATAAESEAVTPPPRLLDSDPSKFRSLKQVIVVGQPGSGTDGVGDALKKLGFKVYDFQAASNRYERDFPLWLEAARLHQEGRPYNQSDYDKVIGDHNALVGAPTSFFDHEFIKLYPNVKVILVTRESNLDIVEKLLGKVTSRFWQRIDPVYHGNINRFLMLNAKSDNHYCMKNDRVIRETVREKNLFEIHDLIAWVPLCKFLGVPVPDEPAPELHDNTIQVELAARPQRVFPEKAKKTGRRMVVGLMYTFTMVSTTLVSALAVLLGSLGLFKLSSLSLQLFNFLVACSQVRDITRLLAGGIASLTLVCGFVAGCCLARMRIANADTVASPRRDYQRRNKNGRRKGKQCRGRQSEDDENTRPERPTHPKWSGVQENIRKDDAEVRKEGKATFEEWKNGKHVAFHVTHKRTESGQGLFSGPRKILSVTEETIE
ncbi:hypothetical protein BU25DRAFT_5526 [Macroventuria anomochaeta]|uniref:Uncharacterized protein n=1 Tax=Macroventuria anomochaeta TaxID=301207 RepID=A0ACB6SHD4_9PLEO|nr:uncharacterized protein BU25DRAFT_5526 [Macroventuria anomochaeta]KAF2633439.1 hypothetical protein BU25DRAFT_5526 [Macroventuria anomochaeta]